MKLTSLKTAILTLFLFVSGFLYSQAPQRMSYQSIIRNADGVIITNSAIGVKVSILKDSQTGTAVYEETFSGNTNENGLLTLEIGGGTPVSGTFAAINWSTGIYYVKTETDPAGGTNYSITGVGQLLSVPYAFYSSSSSNQGKTTIILTGDITDAEAVEQIAREVGYNTENIIVNGTTQLTIVDFGAATNLLSIDISENQALTQVNFPNLSKVFRDIDIEGNPSLTQLNFPALKYLHGKNFKITSNILLETIALPLLENAPQAYFIFDSNYAVTQISFGVLKNVYSNLISNNLALTSISFPQLLKCNQLNIQECQVLNAVDFNSLTTVNNFSFRLNPAITTVTFPQVGQFLGGIAYEDCVSLQSISMPLVNNCTFTVQNLPALTTLSLNAYDTGDIGIVNTGMTTFALPNLHHPISLNIVGNEQLTSVDFSTVQTVGYFLSASHNPNLTTITIPDNLVFTNTNTQNVSLSFVDNVLSSTVINAILHKALNALPATGNIFNLGGQTPAAPPTGQGIADKQTLITNGNTVTTD